MTNGAPKKGLPTIAWVAIGCAGILVVGMVVLSALGFFAAKKGAEILGDLKENPAATAAEMIVKMNPDLELVESDREAGTITVKDKKTGEVVTLGYDELEKGKLSFQTDEGEMSVSLSTGAEGGTPGMTVTGPDGEASYQLGGGDLEGLPAWIPVAPSASGGTSLFRTAQGGKVSGSFWVESDEAPETLVAFYDEAMKTLGLEVSTATIPGPEGTWTVLTGSGPDHDLGVQIGTQGGKTRAAVQYSGPDD